MWHLIFIAFILTVNEVLKVTTPWPSTSSHCDEFSWLQHPKSMLKILPHINFLWARLISDNFRGHPCNCSSKCHLRTLLTKLLTCTKVRDFKQVVVSYKNTDKQSTHDSTVSIRQLCASKVSLNSGKEKRHCLMGVVNWNECACIYAAGQLFFTSFRMISILVNFLSEEKVWV